MSRPTAPTLGRRLATRWLTHTYTRTPMVDGTQDSEGNEDSVEGSPVTGQPCLYVFKDQYVTDAGGARTVSTPTLTIGPDDPLAVGDLVANIVDAAGVVLLAGPAAVETIDPVAGSGTSVIREATLRGTTVQRST